MGELDRPRPPMQLLAEDYGGSGTFHHGISGKGAAVSSFADTSDSLDHRIERVIDTNPYLVSRRVHIDLQGGQVTLRGVVSSFYHKQMAQEIVRRIEGVERIENELEVEYS